MPKLQTISNQPKKKAKNKTSTTQYKTKQNQSNARKETDKKKANTTPQKATPHINPTGHTHLAQSRHALSGYPLRGRLEPTRPRKMARNANGPADVAPDRQRCAPRRDEARFSPAAAAGGAA